MKQKARYKIEFESASIRWSSALMGLAFFCQAIFFFAFTDYRQAGGGMLAFCLVIPMILEVAWVVLLHSVKLNAAGIYGILGTVFCLLLAIQVSMLFGAGQAVIAWLMYLLAAAGMVMITGGFFPYKYIGAALFALLFVIRFFSLGVIGMVKQGSWAALAQALPEVCLILALMLFMTGITGVRKQK